MTSVQNRLNYIFISSNRHFVFKPQWFFIQNSLIVSVLYFPNMSIKIQYTVDLVETQIRWGFISSLAVTSVTNGM